MSKRATFEVEHGYSKTLFECPLCLKWVHSHELIHSINGLGVIDARLFCGKCKRTFSVMSPSARLEFLRKRFEVYYGDEQFIYALNDPRDGQRRYVGRANNPKRRYGQHIQTARIRRDYLPIVCHHQNIPRQKWDNPLSSKTWIAKLLKSGKKPQLEILEGVTPPVRVSEREMRWISQSIKEGHELLNAENLSEGVRKLIREQKVESFLTVDLDKLIKSNFPNELESLLGLRDTGWRRATLIHLLYKTRPKLTIGFHSSR